MKLNEYKPNTGEHIEEAASKAIELKRNVGDQYVYMKFNQTELYIGDDATIDGVVSAYGMDFGGVGGKVEVNE